MNGSRGSARLEMESQRTQVAEAFSRKALVYDDFGAGHENLSRMRQKVRRHVLGFLRPGERILELNAGTGADAVFFARGGFQVHATDLSPGMVAQIDEKIRRYRLEEKLSAQQCSFFELEKVSGRPYDYVFSNMGGVNCAENLGPVACSIKQALAPGGTVTLVAMPPVCLWEMARAARGDFKTAVRRLSPGGVLANVEGVRFMTYYYSPRQVIRAFGKDYQPARLQGLSVFTPTADLKDFPRRYPRLYRALRFLDERLADLPPFNGWGDFFILTLRYLPEAHAA